MFKWAVSKALINGRNATVKERAELYRGRSLSLAFLPVYSFINSINRSKRYSESCGPGADSG